MHTTKLKILNHTIELIGEEGISGLSAGNLVKKIGMSKSTIFHHFESIDQLLIEAFDLLIDLLFIQQENKYTSLQEYLEGLGEQTLYACENYNKFITAYFMFFTKSLFNSEIKQKLKKSITKFKNNLQNDLSPYFSKEEVKDYAELIFNSLDGMAIHYLIFKNKSKFQKSWNLLSNKIAI
ncbi:MAG: TetR/AcrR family transcriptional regulator [Saccharospirillaceae bacterium]|nr:TetR/AcrR family transcriptional regulator [Pseudomonadales bacterium]NRB79683.1 TetR/AcrR family transcriptional regulator [Saccharospirillaceae bacterium]